MRARRRGWVVLAALAVLLGGCDWGHVGFGPARTGHNVGEDRISPENVHELVEAWSVSLFPPSDVNSVQVGSPVTWDGSVFVAGSSGGGTAGCADPAAACKSGFYALSARTGAQRWAAESGRGFDGRPPQRFDPTAVDGRVFGGTIDSRTGSSLASLDATTGALQWTNGGGLDPAVAAGIVFSGAVASGGWLASDARTGAVLFGGRGPTLRGAAVAGGVLYGVADGQLVAYDAAGGPGCTGTAPDRRCEPLWRGEARDLGFATPVVSGGTVYVTTADGELRAYDAGGCGRPACTPRWIGPAGGEGGAIAVADGTVFVRGGDGRLHAFSAAGCGQPVCLPSWSAPTGEASGGAPAVANGVVFVGSGDGRLFAVAAGGCGSRSCRPLWSTAVAGPVFSSPAVAQGRVFVGSGGTLQAFALPGDR